MENAFLLVIGNRQALAWVLGKERMAFGAHRESLARELQVGDHLFIYTTRGCFHNPTRHRSRVIGEAVVASGVERLDEPIELAAQSFLFGCDLEVKTLARPYDGVEVAPLVPRLKSFHRKEAWSVSLRRPLAPLTPEDALLLHRRLSPLVDAPRVWLDDYLALGHPPRGTGTRSATA